MRAIGRYGASLSTYVRCKAVHRLLVPRRVVCVHARLLPCDRYSVCAPSVNEPHAQLSFCCCRLSCFVCCTHADRLNYLCLNSFHTWTPHYVNLISAFQTFPAGHTHMYIYIYIHVLSVYIYTYSFWWGIQIWGQQIPSHGMEQENIGVRIPTY